MRHAASRICLILCVVALCALFAAPALAGYWEICREYSGMREYYSGWPWLSGEESGQCGIDSYHWYYNHFGWQSSNCSGNNDSYASTGACVPVAWANTEGTVTVTLTWVPESPGDLPPDEQWLYEEAMAVWVISSGACYIRGFGSASNSMGGTYLITRYYVGSRLGEVRGTAECKRWSRVNTSSGMVVRSVRIAADASCWIDPGCPGRGEVSVGGGFVSCRLYASPGAPLPQRITPVPWKAGGAPYYPVKPRCNPIDGGSQNGGDPVNLATGEHAYLPAPDITVYNPYGPSVVYTRNFLGGRAESIYSSPGLSAGWVDTYDVSMQAQSPGSWGGMKLVYPNGAEEILSPELNGGQPTGEFTEPTGAPYFATGVPSGTTGEWQSLTIAWRDRTGWAFTPVGGGKYLLSRIANRMGRYISILRDPGSGDRVTSVTDDSSPANTLLTFAYSGGCLSSVTDAYGRKVVYSFGSAAGTTCLLSVSQIAPSGASSPPSRWTYGYQSIGEPGRPRLTSVSFPSPTGSGTSTQTVNYDLPTKNVESLVDANGNRHVFTYEYNNGTWVQVRDSSGELVQEWIENFDPASENVGTGRADAKGYCTTIEYSDQNNPSRPTKVIDKMGRETTFTYENRNIKEVTNPRGTKTVCTYDYSAFPLGRLTSVKEGDKTPTTFQYYEPSGLVQTITSPKPGSTDGSTVETSFTYNALGNVLTKTSPGNNAAAGITTTFNYTNDGSYSQPAKIGQPLTVTDNLGHVTHMRYDARGNLVSAVDALGSETDFTYNMADQPWTITYPQVPE